MSDNTPDFDKMSPEELMKWMETLAKRQGAYEGFTTSADMDIAEADPNSVPNDEPGYVPYGQENKKTEPAKQAPAAAPKPAPAPIPQPIAPPPPPVAAAPEPAASAASAETPDFDKMSPEEIMKWMETLAKRQGAYEGFTTSADMDVAEIDPDTVVIDEPGYVPFEGKEPKRAANAPALPTKPAASTPTPAPAPAPIPVAPPPPPVAAPVAAAPAMALAADGTPDFDKMSPEEIMKWMETLAKRQGAYEGFTTTADMDVAEADPNSVPNDEPGYVPYGQENKKPAAKPAAAAPTPAPTPAPAPAIKPIAVPTPPPAPVAAPAASFSTPAPVGQDALDWLEKLATEPANELPSLDFSGLGELPTADIAEPADTLGWLEGLAAGGLGDLAAPAPAAAAPVGDDPMTWLENLARKQGADAEELTTVGVAPEEFSLDSFLTQTDAPVEAALADNDDPSAWLDLLAEQRSGIPHQPAPKAETPSAPPVVVAKEQSQDVMSALNSGRDVAPDDIANMFSNLMKIAADRDDVADYTFDDDGEEEAADEMEAIQGEIPDWLVDSAPVAQIASPVGVPPLVDLIAEPPAVDDMPDWLKEDSAQDGELENIFDTVSGTTPPPSVETLKTSVPSGVKDEFLNTDDQWIETFELEYQQRTGGTVESAVPTSVPTPAAAISGASDLPDETELPAGEPAALPDWLMSAAASTPSVSDEAVPDWLSTSADQPVSLDWITTDEPLPDAPVVEVTPGELPDWLQEAAVETPDVPDWLLETIGEEDQPVAAPIPAPTSAPAIVPVAPAPKPVAVPAAAPVRAGFPAAAIDVSGALASAQQKVAEGDVDGGLVDYESVVRAGGELSSVLDDLRSLMSRNPNNPAVYRVLGDGLMRSGRLQEALDTYRKALNLL